MSEGTKPPKDEQVPPGMADGSAPVKKPRAKFEDETMVGLTPITPIDEPAVAVEAAAPNDDRTMMHVASAPSPARGKYDDETMRAMKRIAAPEEAPSERRPVLDETMMALAPVLDLSGGAPPVSEVRADEVVEPVSLLEVPIAEPTYPPAAPVMRPTARFDPTMTAGLRPIEDPDAEPAVQLRRAIPADPTRTSYLAPIEEHPPVAAPIAAPPEPRGTVEAIAAALARKHPLAPAEPAAQPPPEAPNPWGSREAFTSEPLPADPSRAPHAPATASLVTSRARGRRIGDTLPVVHQTRFAPFVMNWQLRPPRNAIVVVVKATALYDPNAPAQLVAADPPSGDVFTSHDSSASVRYPSDFAVFKPLADVMLVGDARTPRGGGAVASVRLRVGTHDWHLAVVGNRLWAGSTPTRPEPFERLPLEWEYALGGPLSSENPVGRGYRTGTLLPNLERPDALMKSQRDAPRPICFAPVSPRWRSRAARVGRYDKKWLKSRWPYLPEDFDFGYFNAAPVDLQVPYLKGDEPYEIAGVHANNEILSGRLPGIRPYVFAQKSLTAGGELLALHMNLDTLLFDTRNLTLTMTWRGLLEVDHRDALDLESLYIEEGRLENAPSLPSALERFHALVSSRKPATDEATGSVAPANVQEVGVPPDVRATIERSKSARRPLPPARPRIGRGRAPSTKIRARSREEVVAWLSERRPLSGVDLSGVDLRGLDLRGVDLSGAILIGTLLDGSALDGACCVGMVAHRASSVGASWVGADLTEADLSVAVFDHSDFTDAKLTRVSAPQLRATQSRFFRANLVGASLTDASLDGASFTQAVAQKSDFTGSALGGARFDGADLTDAKLYDIVAPRLLLDGANLTDSRFELALLVGISARGVAATGSVWDKADVTDGTFEGSVLCEARLVSVTASRTLFNKVDAQRASFRGAVLGAANFLKANLTGASFEQADLRGADLRGAQLDRVDTWEAKLSDVDVRLASTTGSKF